MSQTELQYLSFMSTEDSEKWQRYQQGLIEVLSHFGVDKVILATAPKQASTATYAVLVCDHEQKCVYGGIRLELKTDQNKIPIEKIISPASENIRSKIQINSVGGTLAEVCGLWVSRSAKGMGLGAELARAATELAYKQEIKTLVSMLPTHTLDYFLRLGYLKDPDIAPISYPDDRYISTLVWYHVPELLKQSEISERPRPPELSQ